ncbi:MAG: S-layer homology domain-containing protein [Syntrophomonadaceae bacterium]|jgi:hypothetical protein|nr:S-layer homology domain-containing protein [Syntrophomonadaceae bacterium]
MKRIFMIFLALILTGSFSSAAYALPTDFNGGVNNEYEYEEIVFVSGEAIKFTGEVSVSEKDKDDQKTISYKFQLTPEDKSISGKLDRKISYTINYNKRTDKGQTIAETAMDSYKETINIDGVRYELEDYRFNKSDVIDNRPASDFSSGTFEGRKYYTINRNQGKLTITVSGGEVGYDNFWGHTQTQIIDYYLDSTRTIEAEDDEEQDRENSWQGMVRAYVSDSTAKSLRYEDNAAVYSSFAGAHMRVTNEEMASIYEYDLPRIDEEGIPENNRRDVYSVNLNKQMVPKIEKLIIPKFRDLGGHWAEDYINQLYSLDVFSENSAFFAPDIPMSRIDFIEAVVKACDIRPSNQANTKPSTRRKEAPEVSPYYDLDASNPAYAYIKAAVEKGIASGVSDTYFAPDDNLTRVQAVTILIRALGFENVAPTPGYQTSFYDNDQIPSWGIDSVYMGQRIGLVGGDTFNRLNPNQALTKAEAAVMLVRFLNFLQEDLQKDYRDNIVLFRS